MLWHEEFAKFSDIFCFFHLLYELCDLGQVAATASLLISKAKQS